MGDKKEFKEALSGKKVPLLTLDQKWHQLFERNGKPIRVQRLEDKIKGLLTKQARKLTATRSWRSAQSI